MNIDASLLFYTSVFHSSIELLDGTFYINKYMLIFKWDLLKNHKN